ncbi:unnamed protein product [Staurois parvus]|uniref:Uncharacterized protein n=1 Tax=Staurois parvus TaxID=386267 RepID=A0ABN9DJ29_9NEOB|nr:unnamed protein product [Staurois parvus]
MLGVLQNVEVVALYKTIRIVFRILEWCLGTVHNFKGCLD